jgi:poly(A)-specific ribonuclease
VFPRIIDTKYLATYAEGDLNASPNLEDIAESLSDQPLPHIVTHADHPKYQDTKAFHEAGYDSLLTATIMIKLAAKLGVERNVSIPIPIRVVDHSSSDDSFKSAKSNLDVSDFVRDGREKVDHPVPLPPVEQPVQNQPKIVQKQTKKKKLNKKQREQAKKAAKREAQRKFQTKNIFDTLRGESSGSSTEEEVEEEEEESAPQPSMNGESGINGDGAGWDEPVKPARTWENDVFQDKSKWVKIEQMERQPMELIPGFDHSSFWSEFGNTLRVFGTEEAVLRIADWKS